MFSIPHSLNDMLAQQSCHWLSCRQSLNRSPLMTDIYFSHVDVCWGVCIRVLCLLTYGSGRSTHGEVVGEVRRERQARRGEHAAGARVHAQRPAGGAARARAVAHRAVGARVAVQRRHLGGGSPVSECGRLTNFYRLLSTLYFLFFFYNILYDT